MFHPQNEHEISALGFACTSYSQYMWPKWPEEENSNELLICYNCLQPQLQIPALNTCIQKLSIGQTSLPLSDMFESRAEGNILEQLSITIEVRALKRWHQDGASFSPATMLGKLSRTFPTLYISDIRLSYHLKGQVIFQNNHQQLTLTPLLSVHLF